MVVWDSLEGLNGLFDELSLGDSVLINDRVKELVVTDIFVQERGSDYEQDGYIVEMKGNGTTYHMICRKNPQTFPLLFKKSEWTETADPPRYHGRGERVYRAES